MQDMINYEYSFKLNQEKFPFGFADFTYYIEFVGEEDSIVWWKEYDEWEFNNYYTREDFNKNVEEGIWILQ